MKFATEKKPTLCIYTSEVAVESTQERAVHDTMDTEMTSLKKDLEATKSALKLQTLRCRQLVSAFTKKLQEKEVQLLAGKDLRDQQLSRLLRALLVLESRLKKEQKLIRQQLCEKDKVIETQRYEIARLKKEFKGRKRLSGDSSEAEEQSRKLWGTQGSQQQPQSLSSGEERLDNLCRGITDIPSTQDGRAEQEQKGSAFKDNPVLESVNQILLRDEEDLLTAATPCTKVMSLENGTLGGCEWYETDTSLVVADGHTDTGAWCISMVEEGREEAIPHEGGPATIIMRTKDKLPSPPVKAQLLEEKVCLGMSRKNLTIAKHKDLEEVDLDQGDERSVSPSYQELKPVKKKVATSETKTLQKPPALPPKPPRLLKPYQILQNPRHQHSVPSTLDDRTPDQSDKKYQTVQTVVTLNLGQAEMQRCQGQLPTSTRHKHPVPATRIPPTSGKFHVQEMKRNQMNGHIPGNVKPQGTFDAQFETGFAKSPPRVKTKEEVLCETGFAKSPSRTKTKDDGTGSCGAIRMGSTVSSLITGTAGDSIVTELSGEQSAPLPQVSQLVKQFEVLNTSPPHTEAEDASELNKNFEEFKLEEMYVEGVGEGKGEGDGRPEGDGAETRNMVNHYATLAAVLPSAQKKTADTKMYETFLETTGLSQKSILTPSRMLSNHRSCLKPKDVKHRSRVKAAAVGSGSNTVKYWTEPFL